MTTTPTEKRRLTVVAGGADADRRLRGKRMVATDGELAGAPTEAVIGRFAHQVIADLLAAGHTTPDPKTITKAVMAQPLETIESARPHAAAQQLCVSAALYFRLFATDPDWHYAGHEVPAGGVRFDLVFKNGSRVRTDQIKTGRMEMRLEVDSLEEQVARELRAGKKKWGTSYVGLRAVVLGAPRKSFLLDRDGARTAVSWDGV